MANEPDTILVNKPRDALDRIRVFLNADTRAGPDHLASLEAVQAQAIADEDRMHTAVYNQANAYIHAHEAVNRIKPTAVVWSNGLPVLFQHPNQINRDKYKQAKDRQDLYFTNLTNWSERSKRAAEASKAAKANLRSFQINLEATYQGMKSIRVARLFRYLENKYLPCPTTASGSPVP